MPVPGIFGLKPGSNGVHLMIRPEKMGLETVYVGISVYMSGYTEVKLVLR